VDLSLLAKLNPKLEEQQDDYMFHVLREQSTPVCPLYEALAQTKYTTAGFSHATVTDYLFTDPRAVSSFQFQCTLACTIIICVMIRLSFSPLLSVSHYLVCSLRNVF
jgi:hypothetical protein